MSEFTLGELLLEWLRSRDVCNETKPTASKLDPNSSQVEPIQRTQEIEEKFHLLVAGLDDQELLQVELKPSRQWSIKKDWDRNWMVPFDGRLSILNKRQ